MGPMSNVALANATFRCDEAGASWLIRQFCCSWSMAGNQCACMADPPYLAG